MNLNLKEITFIIVSYKAKKVIYNCINSLPKFSKIIVIENSSDQYLKSDLECYCIFISSINISIPSGDA